METTFSQDWVNMIAEQATPKTLNNGRTLLLMIGHSPPAKGLNTLMPFWECDLETSRILLNLIDHLSKWEEHLSDTQ